LLEVGNLEVQERQETLDLHPNYGMCTMQLWGTRHNSVKVGTANLENHDGAPCLFGSSQKCLKMNKALFNLEAKGKHIQVSTDTVGEINSILWK
jgi:hypothetical protein